MYTPLFKIFLHTFLFALDWSEERQWEIRGGEQGYKKKKEKGEEVGG